MQPAAQADSQIAALNALLLHAPDAGQAGVIADRLEALRIEKLAPTTRLLLNRAQRELAASKTRDALDDVNDAIELQPDQALLWRQRAAVDATQGDADAAVTDLGGALSRDPSDILSWSELSSIEQQRSQPRQAYEAWEHVLQLDPAIADGAARLRHLHRQMMGDPT